MINYSKKQLYTWITNNAYDIKGRLKGNLKEFIYNRLEIKNSLYFYTSFLSDDSSLFERIYCILNDIEIQLYCPICDTNKLQYKTMKYGYSKTCFLNSCKKQHNSIRGKGRKNSKESKVKVSKSIISKKYKGKTWEERYGVNKAEKMKVTLSQSKKGVTWKGSIDTLYKRKEKAAKIMQNNNKVYYEEWQEFRNKNYIDRYGKEKALETSNKISEGNTNKIRSKEQKEYLSRIATIQRAKEIKNNYQIGFPAYNKKACEFFQLLDKILNTKGRYAVYGNGEYLIEELGYWPDYINFDKKLIIEWDEEGHFKQDKLKEKDIIRQNRIEQFLPQFKFIRIRENDISTYCKEINLIKTEVV